MKPDEKKKIIKKVIVEMLYPAFDEVYEIGLSDDDFLKIAVKIGNIIDELKKQKIEEA